MENITPTTEVICAINTICKENNLAVDDLLLIEASADMFLYTAERNEIGIFSSKIFPIEIKSKEGESFSLLQKTRDYMRCVVGICEFYCCYDKNNLAEFTREGPERIYFWSIRGRQDYYPIMVPAVVIRKQDYCRFHKIISRRSRLHKKVEPPVMPKNMLNDLYENTIGFLKRGHEVYKKYNIPFKRGVILAGKPGNGKCVNVNTTVFTDKGMLPIGHFIEKNNIKENEIADEKVGVFGINGKEFTNKIYNGGKKKTKKILTSMGFELECTPNHKVITTDGMDIIWKKSEDLKPGDYVAVPRGMNLFGKDTNLNYAFEPHKFSDKRKETKIPKTLTIDLAYFLGILSGDGCLSVDNVILFAGTELVDKFDFLCKKLFNNNVYSRQDKRSKNINVTLGNARLKRFINNIGLKNAKACEKEVPTCILVSPKIMVKAYLQGLFDTDGWSTKTTVGFASCSEKMAKMVHVILTNFGIISKLRYRKNDKSGSWDVCVSGAEVIKFYDRIGFALDRKQNNKQYVPKISNTNVDIVPFDKDFFKKEMADCGKFCRAIHREFDRYKRGTRKPSHAKAKKIIDTLKSSKLKKIARDDIFWDKIKTIENSVAEVADFYVPKTNSFAAGGFINHNTLACRWLIDLCKKNRILTKVVTFQEYRNTMSACGGIDFLFNPFQKGRKGIIFFDDLDLLLTDRKSGNSGVLDFLSGLDGIHVREGVVYVFATNEIEGLDEAAIRPNRIDLFLRMNPPVVELRQEFIRKKFPLEIMSKISEEKLIEETDGVSFAELEEIRRLFCIDLIEKREIDLDRIINIFKFHRKNFPGKTFGFKNNIEEEIEQDYSYPAFAPFPDMQSI
jgi:intein/homing endonuclease